MVLACFILQYVHYLQRKYSLSSFNLLGHTAPAQAASLMLLGPFLDYWMTNKRVDAYDYNIVSVVSASFSISWYRQIVMNYVFILCYADVHRTIMHHSSRNQPEPIHMHRAIHCSFIPSNRAHEDNPRFSNGLHLLR